MSGECMHLAMAFGICRKCRIAMYRIRSRYRIHGFFISVLDLLITLSSYIDRSEKQVM